MRPATIRRLLVFGVCLVGVGCLYLVPSMAGAPRRVGADTTSPDVSASSAAGTAMVTAISASPTAARTAGASPTDPTAGLPSSTAGSEPTGGSDDARRRVSGAQTGATAVDPGRDPVRPPAVGRVTVDSSDAERLVISWPEVDDDDLVGYQVWLNGFYVVTVSETRARLAWFNDSDSHVIQVRALDAAGHLGPSSPTLLVSRPVPVREPSPPPASPSSTPPNDPPSSAPPSDENAEAAPEPNTVAPSPTPAEAGDTEEAHP